MLGVITRKRLTNKMLLWEMTVNLLGGYFAVLIEYIKMDVDHV